MHRNETLQLEIAVLKEAAKSPFARRGPSAEGWMSDIGGVDIATHRNITRATEESVGVGARIDIDGRTVSRWEVTSRRSQVEGCGSWIQHRYLDFDTRLEAAGAAALYYVAEQRRALREHRALRQPARASFVDQQGAERCQGAPPMPFVQSLGAPVPESLSTKKRQRTGSNTVKDAARAKVRKATAGAST